MNSDEIQRKVLELSIEQWNRSFGGISALDICGKLSISNEIVMNEMEKLCDQGKGSINANVELCVIKIDLESPKFEMPSENTLTHVFFPSKEILTEYFFSSSLVRERHPEYKNRLQCGAHQLGLVMFSDEVLTRYFDHPEFYEIDDSLSGGHIWTKSEAPENRYLYVRHGKRKLEDGRTAVTAIYKDLYAMSSEEQRHWHAYELEEPKFDSKDPNFARFVARTYDGAFVDFPNPIKDVITRIGKINDAFGEEALFKRTQNDHFRAPVENTRKAYYDCCSELYKLIGPDNLNQKIVKKVLQEVFSANENELIHSESKRPLSSLQLLGLLEDKMEISGLLTSKIRAIGNDRVEADHKITDSVAEECNFVDLFIEISNEFVDAADTFEREFRQIKIT